MTNITKSPSLYLMCILHSVASAATCVRPLIGTGAWLPDYTKDGQSSEGREGGRRRTPSGRAGKDYFPQCNNSVLYFKEKQIGHLHILHELSSFEPGAVFQRLQMAAIGLPHILRANFSNSS